MTRDRAGRDRSGPRRQGNTRHGAGCALPSRDHRRRHQRCRPLSRPLPAGDRLPACRQRGFLRGRERGAVTPDPRRDQISRERRVPAGPPVDPRTQPAAQERAALCEAHRDGAADPFLVRRHRAFGHPLLRRQGQAQGSRHPHHEARPRDVRRLRSTPPRAAAPQPRPAGRHAPRLSRYGAECDGDRDLLRRPHHARRAARTRIAARRHDGEPWKPGLEPRGAGGHCGQRLAAARPGLRDVPSRGCRGDRQRGPVPGSTAPMRLLA